MNARPTPDKWFVSPETSTPEYSSVCSIQRGCEVARCEDLDDACRIAAAPDHALLAAALCAGAARWEPFKPCDGRGEVCVSGLRHCTTLDEFGVPQLDANLRTALREALS